MDVKRILIELKAGRISAEIAKQKIFDLQGGTISSVVGKVSENIISHVSKLSDEQKSYFWNDHSEQSDSNGSEANQNYEQSNDGFEKPDVVDEVVNSMKRGFSESSEGRRDSDRSNYRRKEDHVDRDKRSRGRGSASFGGEDDERVGLEKITERIKSEFVKYAGQDKGERWAEFVTDAVEEHYAKKRSSGNTSRDSSASTQGKKSSLYRNESIAVVGSAGRYPGANRLSEFWSNLSAGVDSVKEIPRERWNTDDYYDPQPGKPGKIYSKWLGALDHVECFDSLFFNISPAEAEYMDPQHRIFLEVGYHAFEDAGYGPEVLNNLVCGVYLGIVSGEYTGILLASGRGAGSTTGNSTAIAAARIAYHLNLKGPALAIDTACSSSLVAMHSACIALLAGEVDMALAGGVSLYLSPATYVGMCAAKMLSPDGKCKAFDNSADGFVPGEGAGALVLKRLTDAEKDNDNILGLIIASSTNQDGKTNGITAPSKASQVELVKNLHDNCDIDAGSISYVDLHGTGTKLGDPIELSALSSVFGERSGQRQYCAIGSVKTNIGHSSAAAGVASAQKVLLQMKYRELAPSLHFKRANEHFDFANSPFYVNDKPRPWIANPGARRRAAVSSFGFSGTNAHVVMEEYIPTKPGPTRDFGPQIITVSAQTPEQLDVYIEALLDCLYANPELKIEDVAYTLQLGRAQCDHRFALVVHDRDSMVAGLKLKIQGKDSADSFSGKVGGNHEILELFGDDSESSELLKAWFSSGRLHKVAQLWAKGFSVNWKELYDAKGGRPRRVSLPGYPFLRTPHWIDYPPAPKSEEVSGGGVKPDSGVINPLLQKDISDTKGLRFTSIFYGDEFFFTDHKLHGKKVLPSVAYLEMASAAADYLYRSSIEAGNSLLIKNVVWVSPFLVRDGESSATLDTAIDRREGMGFKFRMFSPEEGYEEQLHCQGELSYTFLHPGDAIDVDRLRVRCSRDIMTSDYFYHVFSMLNIEYGKAHRCVESVSIGRDEVLARVSLPEDIPLEGYELHPGLMDSVLQVNLAVGMSSNKSLDENLTPKVTFGLDRMEILRKCPRHVWVWTRYSEGYSSASRVTKMDIDVIADDGEVCIRLRGHSALPIDGETLEKPEKTPRSDDSSASGNKSTLGLQQLIPEWHSITPEFRDLSDCEGRTLLLGGDSSAVSQLSAIISELSSTDIPVDSSIDEIASVLSSKGAFDHIIWNVPSCNAYRHDSEGLLDAQVEGVGFGFRLVKALLALEFGVRPLQLTVLTEQTQAVSSLDALHPAHASVHGFCGSLAKEYQNWKIKLIDLPAPDDSDTTSQSRPWSEIMRMPFDPVGAAKAYRYGGWFQRMLVPFREMRSSEDAINYRQDGVYLVIGGAGGLGVAWTEWVLRHHNVQVVWLGRRKEDEEIRAKLKQCARFGTRPIYIQADASDRSALERVRLEINAQFGCGSIKGIIHSSIVLADSSILKMNEEMFSRSLDAKTCVSLRIGQVFASERLDWVVFFSSMQSFTREAGQSNYAAGCNFKDAYAQCLDRQWECTVRTINWGYWGNTGIVASEEYRRRMAANGIDSIEPDEAMGALEQILSGRQQQVGLLKINNSEVLQYLCPPAYVVSYENRPQTRLTTDIELVSRDTVEASLEMSRRPLQQVEAVLLDLLWTQLKSAQLISDGGVPLLGVEKRLAGGYRKWFEHSLRVLAEKGYLTIGERGYEPLPNPPYIDGAWDAWNSKKAVWRMDPAFGAQIELIDNTLQALPEILTGAKLATDILFREREAIGEVYKDSSAVSYFNKQVAAYVEAYAKLRFNSGEPLKILEVGAGTGGTSAVVFDVLRPYQSSISEYCYTDISKAFLFAAEEQFGESNPFLRYELFNVELSPEEQGIDVDAYDIVIATNVLHATKNIRTTLRNIKALLKTEGILLLHEMADTGGLMTHLTFGLLKGWWLFEDEELRIPGSPVLTPETWLRVLETEGYHDIAFPAELAHALGSQVVVAYSDGNVRKPQNANKARIETNATTDVKATSTSTSTSTSVDLNQEVDKDWLCAKVREFLISSIAKVLKMEPSQIGGSTPLEKYGLDSILSVQLTSSVSQFLPDISSTLFFEYHTVDALVEHFVSSCEDVLYRHFSCNEESTGKAELSRGEVRSEVLSAAEGRQSDERLSKLTSAFLKERVAKVLKMAPDQIDEGKPLHKYGLDSIISVHLTGELSQVFPDMSSTLFFEHQTIDAIVEHFLGASRDKLVDFFGSQLNTPSSESAAHFEIYDSVAKPVPPSEASGSGPTSNTGGDPASAVADVAVIGMAGRFPEADNLDEFWKNMCEGVDCVTAVPDERWNHKEYYDPDKGKMGKTYCNWGSFIDGIENFDPLFFDISPREANCLEPQVRLFMQTSWDLMESAGYTRKKFREQCNSNVGVFVGSLNQQYQLFNTDYVVNSVIAAYPIATIANRVSSFLDIHGPSMALDTFCSSSMVALHLACTSVRNGESYIAIAGGVNHLIHPKHYLSLSMGLLLGSDNKAARSFGPGDGFVPSEGVGAVMLKRLDHARRDRDKIFAVVKSTVHAHGGLSSGFGTIDPHYYVDVLEKNFTACGIDPRTISCFEAASNGNSVSDAYEVAALNKIFRSKGAEKRSCVLGTVKSYFGHLEAASGIAQVIKTVLQMKHRQLPPTIHADPMNPDIHLDDSPLYIQRELGEWSPVVRMVNGEEIECPRRAAINTFGGGGSIAHAIIEEYNGGPVESAEESHDYEEASVIPLSARSRTALQGRVNDLLEYLNAHDGVDLNRLSYSLIHGREPMEYRLASVVKSVDELRGRLVDWQCNETRRPESNDAPGDSLWFSGCIFKRPKEATDAGEVPAIAADASNEDRLRDYAFKWVRGAIELSDVLFNYHSFEMLDLPGYPYDNRRCWLEETPKVSYKESLFLSGEEKSDFEKDSEIDTSSVDAYIYTTVCAMLGMESGDLDLDEPISRYRNTGLFFGRVALHLSERLSLDVDYDLIVDCRTVNELIYVVNELNPEALDFLQCERLA